MSFAMKVRIPKKMGVAFSFILTYLVMLLLPLLLGIFIYATSVQVIEEEIGQSNEALLDQLRESIDSRMIGMREMAQSMAMDTRVSALTYQRLPMDMTYRYSMVNIIRDFRASLVPNRYIDRFFIYIHAHDIALTSKGTYDARSLYALWYPDDTLGFETWFEEMATVSSPRFSLQGNASDPTLLYMQPLSLNAYGASMGTIAFFIQPATIQKSLGVRFGSERDAVMIIDKNGKMLFLSRKDSTFDSLSFENIEGMRGIFPAQVNGERSLVSYIGSNVTDWKYVYLLPMSVYHAKITHIQTTSLIVLAAILVIGGLLIAYFVYINYNPILRILRVLKKPGDHLENRRNEYTLIQEIVSSLMQERNRMSDEIGRKTESLKRLYIASLLQEGAPNGDAFQEANAQYGYCFTNGSFMVAVFEIEELGNLLERETEAYFIIQNVFEELASGTPAAFAEVGGFLACLINPVDEPDEKPKMRRILEQVLIFIEEKLDVLVSVACSSIHTGIADIPEAYQESMDAMEHKHIDALGGLIDYDVIMAQSEPERDLALFIQEEIKLDNLLVNCEFAKARAVLDDVFTALAEPREAQIKEAVRFRMVGLMNTVLRALHLANPLHSQGIVGSLSPIKRLMECQRPEEFRKCFGQVLSAAEACFSAQDRDILLEEDLTRYIKEHYADPNLCLTMVAEAFGMNASTLSRCFRKKVGMGMLEFIHKTRISEAKALLSRPDISIKAIAGRVGLDSSDALIRIFKKYEGVTPGSYREAQLMNERKKTSRSARIDDGT